MYRIIFLIIICTACNSTGKRSQPPAGNPRSLHLALEKDSTQRQMLASKIQTADMMAGQHCLDSALQYYREADALTCRFLRMLTHHSCLC